MSLNNKKILVTGADGFIGSHLAEELVRQDYNVRAFVLYNSFNSWGWLDYFEQDILKSLDIFTGDIRDPYGVKEAMKGCDIVIHLAALIAIPFSYHSPAAYVETNVKGTLHILQAARDLGIEKVIHTSTSEVYGTAKFVPITEDHPLQPQSPYSATKIGADSIALSFYHSFDTPVTIVRPFNTFGPRQSARAIIPTVIMQIADSKKRIAIGALHPTRDFNYVTDIVRGFIAAMGSRESIGEVINLGSNYEISMADTVNLIADIMGVEIQIETDPGRMRPEKSEVGRLWSDNSKAKRLLGWEPLYGGLNGFTRGLTETIQWFADADNLKKYKTGIYNL
jgi:NAD dependent epimerase/dehydratase